MINVFCTALRETKTMESHRSKQLARAAQNEAIRIGRARGYKLEEVDHLLPKTIAQAGGGGQVGIPARANERLVDIVNKVGRGELKQDPRHITELRLNRAR